MNEYEKQAMDFLIKTNSTLEVKFLKFDYHFTNDKEKRNIYIVKLSKGSRVFSFPYGDSIANTKKMICKLFNPSSLGQLDQYEYYLRAIKEDLTSYNDIKLNKGITRYNKAIESMKEYSKDGESFKPSNYSILSCLNFEEFENIDDFVDCFGYSPEDQKVSELLKTFEAVQNESKQLKILYSDTELELLNDIN